MEIARPQKLAGGGVEAIDLPGGALRVQLAVMESRRGARTGAGLRLFETLGVAVHPNPLARLDIVTDDHFSLPPLFLREGAVADNGERAPPGADAVPPEQLRRVLVPVTIDSDSGQATISV